MKILLAVSGGIDSMVMADMALRGRILGGSKFGIAHCNFRLRGDESDADESLVREFAAKHDTALYVKGFDTREYAAQKHISIEMAARDLRYGWFAEICREFGYGAVAVAHNANDNAETLLLNLLRGTGIDGICGMPEEGILPVEGCDIPLLRPMKGFERAQIEEYSRYKGVSFRTDRTNLENDAVRNRIRNLVFPILKEINPSFIKTFNKETEHFNQIRDIVDKVIPPCDRAPLPAIIGVEELLATPHWKFSLFRRLQPYGVSSAVIENIGDLIESERTFAGKSYDAGAYVIETSKGKITVREKETGTVKGCESMVICQDGSYSFNGSIVSFETISRSELQSLRQPKGCLVMDAEHMGYPISLRRRRSGDWMIPFGMKGRRKLSDLFSDLHMDIRAKEEAIIVEMPHTNSAEGQESPKQSPNGKERVAAVAGLRQDASTAISDSTREVLRITITRE